MAITLGDLRIQAQNGGSVVGLEIPKPAIKPYATADGSNAGWRRRPYARALAGIEQARHFVVSGSDS